MEASPSAVSDPPVARIVAAGLVALAVAMGIGRFAFTPLLPLMLRDGTLNAATGAEWAAANYVGYLAGALTAGRFARDPRAGLRLGLLGVALTTLALAAVEGEAGALVGAALRLAAGVFSAWVLVCVSSWCLAELARRGVSRFGAWVYIGVGLGIALAGVLCWVGGQQPAGWLWLELGLLAALGLGFVCWAMGGPASVAPPVAGGATPAAFASPPSGHWPWVLCYGSFGFGYIVPATFLPAMARQQVADPLVFGLTWPIFGLAAALSVAGAACWLVGWPRQRVWAIAHAAMALGTALAIATHALWALALSAVLVGGTFMVATMAGLQLARELHPSNPTPLLARMTMAFAAGQIAGPLLVRTLGTGFGSWDALACANAVATVLLVLTAGWLWRGMASFSPSTPAEACRP